MNSTARPTHKSLAHALLAVMEDVTHVQKEASKGLSYTFASEVAIVTAIREAFIRHGLVIMPTSASVAFSEMYQTAKGGQMNRVIVEMRYKLIHADSGQFEALGMIGEAADAGDKATPKACTIAYKYVLRQLDLLVTGEDPDRTPSHEVARGQAPAKAARRETRSPAQFLDDAEKALREASDAERLAKVWDSVAKKEYSGADLRRVTDAYWATRNRIEGKAQPAPA